MVDTSFPGPVHGRRYPLAIAVCLGVALTLASAAPSFAAQARTVAGGATRGSGQNTGREATQYVADPCRTIDFEQAAVTSLTPDPARPAPRYRLTVSGTKTASNVDVRLRLIDHIDQPDFWGIMVMGCPSGNPGLPMLMRYTVTYDFTWSMGSCGIEVIGGTRSQRFDLVGCSPIPLAGTKWILDASSLRVPVPEGTNITANFTDTGMSGYTSCNSYWTTYQVDENGAFSVDEIAMTPRACQPAISEVESAFLHGLVTATRVQATAHELRLWGDGQILLRFFPATAT